MANLNQIFLIGRLTKDAEVRFTPSGSAVAAFDMAVNRSYKDKAGNFQEETMFIKVNFWGRQAQNAQDSLIKGKEVFVEGRLRQRSWETQDGQKRSTYEVETFNVMPIERMTRTSPAGPMDKNQSADQPPMEDNSEDVPF